MINRAFVAVFFCAFLSLMGIKNSLSQALSPHADLVITNANILQPDQSFVSALAIYQQKILALGTNEQIARYIGPSTQTIHASGKLIIPGLIDSHMHAIRAGLTYQREVNWLGVHTKEEALDRIREAADKKPVGDWIVIAGGWVPEQFKDGAVPPSEALLGAAKGHPLYLQKLYSSVFISPEGIDKLGLTKRAELLSRLEVALDPRGHATGWLNGNARTISDVFDLLPGPTPSEQYESMKVFFRTLNNLGITGLYDPGGYNFPIESYKTFWNMHAKKELTLRVAYSLSAPKRGTELADFKKLITSLPTNDALLQWNGIGENVTWGMYNNDSPTAVDQKHLQEVLEWAAKEKITVTLHWNNKESITKLFEVIEAVQENYSIKDLRWSIAHINNIDRTSLLRMKKNHLGWLAQDALYFQARQFEEKYGPLSLSYSPLLREAMNLKVPLGFGTDAHRVMDFNPFVALQWLVTGKSIDRKEGRTMEHLLTPYEALYLYTKGSSYFLPDAPLRGELSVGKFADLAILDQNLFTVPSNQIHTIRSELTIVGGKVVFKSGQFNDIRH
jgi:hypothetical protein